MPPSSPVILEVEDHSWVAELHLVSSSPALTPQGANVVPSHDDRDLSIESSFSHSSKLPLASSRRPLPNALAPAQLDRLQKPLPPLPGDRESQSRKRLPSPLSHTALPAEQSVGTCEHRESVRQQRTAADAPVTPRHASSTSAVVASSRATHSVPDENLRDLPSSSYPSRKPLPLPPTRTPHNSPHGQHATLQKFKPAHEQTMGQHESSLTPNNPSSSQQANVQVWDPHVLPRGVSRYLGTEVVGSGRIDYNPTRDIMTITKAVRVQAIAQAIGFPLNQNTLIEILSTRNAKEMQILCQAYYCQHRRHLVNEVGRYVTGPYREGLLLLIRGPLGGDAYLLKEAEKMKFGERLILLTEIIIRREASELTLLQWFVWVTRGIHLEEIVRRLLAKRRWVLPPFDVALNRPRLSHTSSEQLNNDYDILKRIITQGIDDRQMYEIILHRPSDHLRQLCARYQREHSGETVANRLEKDFKIRYIKDILVYAIQSAEVDPRHPEFGDGIWRDMKRIKDVTSKRQDLIRLIRAHWDEKRFRKIKVALAISIAAKDSGAFSLVSMTGIDHKALVRKRD